MADIYLHKYKATDSLNAYTAPQRLRSAKGLKLGDEFIKQIENAWNGGKKNVLIQLISKIREALKFNEIFGFILAPSNTKIFYNDMLGAIKSEFSDGIDFTDCFQKTSEVNAVNINRVLNGDQLKERYFLNKECFLSKYNDNIKLIILIDDVYSFGNTFNGLKLLINEITKEVEFKTAVILKTNE